MNYKEHCVSALRAEGKRITKTRLMVIDVMSESKGAVTPYSLADQVGLDVVTAYRILDVFSSLNLIHKTKDGFVKCSHSGCSNEAHCHHQFVCNDCKDIKEIHIDDRGFIKSLSSKFKDLKINGHHFEFSGLCKNCTN